jgi:hypothetical protein
MASKIAAEVEHPEIEVHSFHTLSRSTGYSPHQLVNLLNTGVFSVLALRHTHHKNIFAVTKSEISKITERDIERKARAERSKRLMEELKAARAAAKVARAAAKVARDAAKETRKAERLAKKALVNEKKTKQ